METRAGYLAVGIAVLAILASAAIFVLWMASNREDTDQYWIDFGGSVAGLRVGSTVAYRGIAVGEVTALQIRPDDVELVRVTIQVSEDTPIRTDTYASLEIQGLAGGVLVQLSGGTQDAAALTKPRSGLPIIPSRPSQLEQLFESAPALVDQVKVLVQRGLLLLSDPNQRAFANILSNSDQLTANLAKASEPADALIADAHKTVIQLRETAENLNRLTTLAEEEVIKPLSGATKTLQSTNDALQRAAQTLIEVESAARKIGNASEQLDGLIAENRGPLRDFTNVTLYDANAFIAEVRELVISFRQVLNDLNRDPSGFLFGNKQRGYEAR
jgi:phospholipid/cholesterol/gamma-HCH transport system substrate-binding protein